MGLFSNLFTRKPSLPSDNSVSMVGKDISWVDIISHVFRVREFDRTGTKIDANGKVIPTNSYKPYGFLLVESPEFKCPVKLPIIHHDDFLLASSVYDDISVSETISRNELLVTYIPKNKSKYGFAGTTHAIHYIIVPQNTLEVYYKNNDNNINQKPQNIFGSFVWEGEIRVGINLDPKL